MIDQEKSILFVSFRCLLGIIRKMPKEESDIAPETEPLLLSKDDLSYPVDVLCSPASLPETLNEETFQRDFETSINNQTTTMNDIYLQASKD